jgi:hypothetical protein
MSPNTAGWHISNTGGFSDHVASDSEPLVRSVTADRKARQRLNGLCDICKDLSLQGLENADDQAVLWPFGLSVSVSHMSRNAQTCRICRLLLRYCFARHGALASVYDAESLLGLQSNVEMKRLAPDERFEFSFSAEASGGRNGRRLGVTFLPEVSHYNHDDAGLTFQMFPAGADKAQLGTRPIDAHGIDLSAVKPWLRNCENHEHSCDNGQWKHAKEEQIFWTIDVRNKRLRRTCAKDRFVALSHVSGGTTLSPLVATAEEFFALVDEGTRLQYALENQPRIIADAMLVVLSIGETLLWVDYLCIPPFSKHRAAQIAIMDQIYGSAALTIVAPHASHAASGLPGLRIGTRDFGQTTEQVGSSLILAVELPHTMDAVTKAPWNNRGWTYQERLLSKRLLIFADETVFGQCKSLLTTDDTALADKNESTAWWPGLRLNDDRLRPSEGTQHTRRFRMQGDELFDDSFSWEYAKAVEEYGKSKLGRDSDMLAAFSGLSRGFAWAGKTDFLWCLPESRIDAALLWEKNFLAGRNHHSGRRRPVSVRFPSWTWAGWKGAVKYPPGNRDSAKVEYTRPCVGWFALKDGKLSLLGPACRSQVSPDMVGDASSQIHPDLKECNLYLKTISLAHPVPTDFCFTAQMLYGYTTVAPIVRFIEYLLETSGIQPTTPFSKSRARSKKGCRLETSVQFRDDKYDITGEAQLNGDCVYEADEIGLVLLSERRRIDKYKDTDLSLGYKVMLVKWDRNGRTATRVGLGRINHSVWWDASPEWREVILT